MSDYKVTDSELTGIANAIRTKGGTSSSLVFPDGFTSAIGAIPTGGGGSQNILGGTVQPTGAIGSDGDIYIKYTDITLPSGYTLLDKIVASGGQYIDTGVPAKQRLKVDVDFKWINAYRYSDSTLLGGTGTTTSVIYIGINPSSSYRGYYFNWGGNFLDIGNRNYQGRNHVIVDLKPGNINIYDNDELIYHDNYALLQTTGDNNLTIFARNGQSNFFGGELYKLIISDNTNNGEVIRYFLPAKRNSDNEIGLFDIVNNTFYTNSGTGSLTAGSEVLPTKPIDTAYLKVSGSWILLEDGDWDDVNTGS